MGTATRPTTVRPLDTRLVDHPSAPRYRRAAEPQLRDRSRRAAPVTRVHRRALPALGAMLAVLGLTLVSGLPAFADEGLDGPPPVAPLNEDVQHFSAPVGGAAEVSGMDVGTGAAAAIVVAPAWQVPVHGELRDGFGPRPFAPVAGVNAFHRGEDVGAPCGTPVHAAAAGRIVQAGWWGTYGNWVMVDHGGGVQTGYAHLSSIGAQVGQVVRAGQVVGVSGSTGASSGCHVHVEVHVHGTAVDPLPFFSSKGAPLGR